MAEKQSGPSVPPSLYTEEYFLTACEGYEEWIATEGEHLSRRLDSAFKIATVTPGMRVLDLGCGRGEIVRHCARLGADVVGVDYAPVATRMTRDLIRSEAANPPPGKMGVAQVDAKKLPFATSAFDRVLMFDVVEHLYPWELQESFLEIQRVLKPDGRLVVHTAPNRWYDQFAYPVVRLIRTALGEGDKYPRNPRQFLVAANEHVHVNEQGLFSMGRALAKGGFRSKVWLESPPQNRQENRMLAGLRHVAFDLPPFSWFFQREVFAVAWKR